MIGAIAGDIIGSIYEWNNIKVKSFPLFSNRCYFTDDTVLTVALADSLMSGTPYADNLRRFFKRYPGRGYGMGFDAWASDPQAGPYYSWGNGAAMRISPVGYAFNDLNMVLTKAEEFTVVTHNHPEGIKGAQATAAAIFLSRNGSSKNKIKEFIESEFGYDIRPAYEFYESCRQTVPPAIRAFYDSSDFEDAIRNAISLGGDSDTLACITGGLAQAFYGRVPPLIEKQVYDILDSYLANIVREFMRKYCPSD